MEGAQSRLVHNLLQKFREKGLESKGFTVIASNAVLILEESNVHPSNNPADIDKIVKYNSLEQNQTDNTDSGSDTDKIFDANGDEAAEQCDAVFWYQMLKCDKKC